MTVWSKRSQRMGWKQLELESYQVNKGFFTEDYRAQTYDVSEPVSEQKDFLVYVWNCLNKVHGPLDTPSSKFIWTSLWSHANEGLITCFSKVACSCLSISFSSFVCWCLSLKRCISCVKSSSFVTISSLVSKTSASLSSFPAMGWSYISKEVTRELIGDSFPNFKMVSCERLVIRSWEQLPGRSTEKLWYLNRPRPYQCRHRIITPWLMARRDT